MANKYKMNTELKTWSITQVKEAVQDILAGYTTDITPTHQDERYFYLTGVATIQADNYTEGEEIQIRVRKRGNKHNEYEIQGKESEGSKYHWLNSIIL